MKIFLDANIILDILDIKREFHEYSVKTYEYLILNHQIFTSCDLITTIYYINAKIDKEKAILNIQKIIKTLTLIEFSNEDVEKACDLMLRNKDFKDLEDTLQYIMAKKQNCNMIISNDENFVSKDIEILNSKEFFNRFIKE
ncbi:hypothetical protein NitYY0826_C0377 [Nitratiruptor sp. YY08-26]|uniref:type II toxin-antitoxin system VapC family toxin n=1 Tax=unclassified Nitratiruptor TaxID=2624044 RepID=UPI001914DD21|nr:MULTISPECIES: PIN domain-containing protein [unclassified Nitratiruptor]BCD61522.1 hypothetical protein NitYY0813_C0376 [Nitratiruptor sp. YY08-13]BCD65456.1 hypothetical protein NitYY0826_C0377 [Nitratiruptor sp. YY08-26]